MPKGVIPRNAFKKGVSANPNGRPKGSYSADKLKFIEIQKRCASDFQEVYNEIRAKMKEGEAWAYQLYVKEFLPKKALEPRLSIQMNEGESRLDALIKALAQLTELTHDEILNEIKALNTKNEVDIVAQQAIERKTEEQLMDEIYTIRKVLEHHEKKSDNKG